MKDIRLATHEELRKVSDCVDIITKYSRIPQIVGTWLDGTPVWRLAFIKQFTEIDIAEKAFSISLPVNDVNNVFITHDVCKIYYTSPCIIDDVPLAYCVHGTRWDLPESLSIEPNTNDGCYGWVEFVTPENNIIKEENLR